MNRSNNGLNDRVPCNLDSIISPYSFKGDHWIIVLIDVRERIITIGDTYVPGRCVAEDVENQACLVVMHIFSKHEAELEVKRKCTGRSP